MKRKAMQNSEGGWVAPLLLVLLAIGLIGGPLLLHFTQKEHNQLPTVDDRIPPDQAFQPGEAFAGTVVALIERELDSRTGWRPNDFVLWGPALWADNNSNRQLGIIQAVRESVRVLKDNLTKVSSDEYDVRLVKADNAFRNEETKLWLPSAESKFREGVSELKRYVKGLRAEPPTSRPISKRNIELIRLYQAWTDLLGGAHAKLSDEKAPWFAIDDYFYQAQGMAHVMYQLTLAVHREYFQEIDNRPALRDLFNELPISLRRASLIKPVAVLNGSPDGFLANHRHNLASYMNEARQKMYSIREELEK